MIWIMVKHVKRRDYEDHVDSEHKLRSLKMHLDAHLAKRPLANSTYHTRQLPVNICEDVVARYSGSWNVSFKIDKGTTFTFIRSG